MPNLITEGGGGGGQETDKKWLRNMWTDPYEVYHNIKHIKFKLDKYYAYHSAEAIHEYVVVYHDKSVIIWTIF